ncbi:MAG: acyl-CoA dehydrogenase [Pseudomonadota bacterium]
MLLTTLIVLAVVALIIAAKPLSKEQSVALAGVALLVLEIASSGFNWLAWGIYGVVAVFVLNDDLRQRVFTSRVLTWYRSVLPEISETEQIAIDSGTVWWDADLFTGDPDWNKLLSVPAPKLTDEEQAYLDGPIEELCQALDDWQITAGDNDLSQEAWDLIRKHKVFGLVIPKQYGGMGFSALAHSEVVMKIASRSYSAAVTCMVPNSLGPGELLLHYGTERQRQHYLPKLATSEDIPCFALTAPTAGSDAGALPDSGIVCKGEYQGKEVLGLKVSWDKRYITLAPVATVLGLAFKAYDPDGLLGDKKSLGITCALIPTDTPGVEIGSRHLPINASFMNGPTRGKDVFIPLEWVIGEEAGVGEGWKMLMGCLGIGRSISLPALGASVAKMAARTSGAYGRVRRQFKTPIARFEGVEEALTDIVGYNYWMEAARRLTAYSVDLGEKPAVLSAVVKYHLTEGMRTTINHAMDLHGGKGIMLGSGNYLARHYQSTPVSITVEGANILTRSMMIFGQGAIRCHPYVLRELQASYSDDQEQGLKDFDEAFMSHVGFAVRNNVRAFTLSLTRNLLASAPVPGPTAKYYKSLSRLSSAFTALADISMFVLGGDLKRKEKISGRLGDALSYLYIGSTVLKRFEDDGRPAEDLPLVEWSMQLCQYRIQEALRETIRNYPSKPWALLMRFVLFPPLGQNFTMPSDELGHSVADIMLSPSEQRDRLTSNIFVSTDPEDATGCVEDAFNKAVAVEPIERKLMKATGKLYQSHIHDEAILAKGIEKGAISEEEAEQLRESARATFRVISVEEFTKEEAAAGGILKSAPASKKKASKKKASAKKTG